MAPTVGQNPRNRRSSENSRPHSDGQYPEFDLPYFAHQQLDPNKYDTNVGLPVGKPEWAPAPKEIATVANGGWFQDLDMQLQEDTDIGSDFETTTISSGKRPQSEIKEEKNPYKRLKVAGGRPAIAKKVTADLDSDDELIVRMKNAKYLEKDIARRLADEGRVAYNPKTIGTRWARLRKAIERRNDELLDAELTDWHDGDDEVLCEAVRRADEMVAKAKADADSRKWKIVADQMKTLKPVVNFSQNACRSRFCDLQSGTAKPTPESIINPDEEVLRRIRSRRDKERRISEDQSTGADNLATRHNLEGNAWTSKGRRYI